VQRDQVFTYVREIAIRLVPGSHSSLDQVAGVDLAHFLRHASDGDVPVFAQAGNFTLCSMVVPEGAVSLGYLQAVMHAGMPGGLAEPGGVIWDGTMTGPGGVRGVAVMCYRPLSGFGLDTLELAVGGELERLSALEPLMERGGPYCPVDSRGSAMVQVGVAEDITLGTVRRGLLSSHLRMTGSVLVRLLDVRHHTGSLRLMEKDDTLSLPAEEIFVRTGSFADPDCRGRAVQVLR
jgi:hypothetical protein